MRGIEERKGRREKGNGERKEKRGREQERERERWIVLRCSEVKCKVLDEKVVISKML